MGLTALFIPLIIIICFIICLKKPVAGVVAYLIVYSVFNTEAWYGKQLVSVLIRPSFTASSILCVGCFMNFDKLNWQFSRRETEIYLFIVLMYVISMFFGLGIHDKSWLYLVKMFKLAVFIFFLIRVVHTLKNFKIIIWTLILCAIFLSWQAHQIGGHSDGRLNNIGGMDFNEANAFATFVAVNIIFFGLTLLRKPLWHKLLIILFLVVMLNALIMAQSRAVFIGSFFALIYLLWKSPKTIKKEIISYVLCATVAFSFMAHEKFWERMGSIDEESKLLTQKDLSWQEDQELSRVDFWKASLHMFNDYPMGVGVKNFSETVTLYDPRNPGMDAHNTYILCYSEIGIIGIIFFIFIIVEAFLQLKRAWRLTEKSDNEFETQIEALSLSTVLVMLITGPMVTHSYLYSEFLWILLSLPICLENALNSKDENLHAAEAS